jgi:hypothetical protein
MKKYRKRGFLLRGYDEFDAENYYRDLIAIQLRELRALKQVSMR